MNNSETKQIPLPLAESFIWRAGGADHIRACLFCIHSDGREVYFERRCTKPEVTGGAGRHAGCIDARALHGPCGIEARYLHLRGE